MQTILTILGFITFIAALLWSVSRHYKKWRYGQQQPDTGSTTPIMHLPELWIRILAFTPAITFFSISLAQEIHVIPAICISILMVAALFWFWFDGLFNLKRGREWWYIGTIDKDEAATDNFKRKIGPTWTKIVQITLMISSIVLYFIFLIQQSI